jgi:NAD(P)-dependent dehydrogenase (short-subunit alcohol dehydrogenase family)
MATTASTIPQSDWDKEKPLIRSLFLCQNRTMAEIVSELASRGLRVTSVLPKNRETSTWRSLTRVQAEPAGDQAEGLGLQATLEDPGMEVCRTLHRQAESPGQRQRRAGFRRPGQEAEGRPEHSAILRGDTRREVQASYGLASDAFLWGKEEN